MNTATTSESPCLMTGDNEQHIHAASCRSRFEIHWETPNFDPPPVEPTLLGGIDLKIGRTNYLRGLAERVKFHICTISGIVWAIG